MTSVELHGVGGEDSLRSGGAVATRRVRVLVVTNMYPTLEHSSYGAFVATQVRSLSAAGAEVTVEFIDGRRTAAAYALAPLRIRRLARSGRFDLVHAHYGLTGWVAGFHALPLVVTYHGDDLLGTPRPGGRLTVKSRITRLLGQRAARRAAAVVCVSDNLRQALGRAADRARARVIPMGVDTTVFSPGERSAARARLGLAPEARLVLFPNTPGEARKRLDLATASVARLNAGRANARLWVVSGVPAERMPDYFRAADCLLLTSDWEGSPMVVKEALSVDLPVVSVDAGDARFWLEQTAGCRVVARDPAAIAAAVAEVLEGPGRVDGAAVRAAVAIECVARRVLAVYREVLGA